MTRTLNSLYGSLLDTTIDGTTSKAATFKFNLPLCMTLTLPLVIHSLFHSPSIYKYKHAHTFLTTCAATFTSHHSHLSLSLSLSFSFIYFKMSLTSGHNFTRRQLTQEDPRSYPRKNVRSLNYNPPFRKNFWLSWEFSNIFIPTQTVKHREKNKNSTEMEHITIITQYGPNPAFNLRERAVSWLHN